MHSINEIKSYFQKKYAFWGKKIISQEFSIFSIFLSDLVGAIGFLEAVDMD